MPNQNPILLVEDNHDDVVLALQAFQRNRITNRIIVKEDGAAALDFLPNREQVRPALVLLDLKLPKVSGGDLLRAIRANEAPPQRASAGQGPSVCRDICAFC